MGSFWPAEMVKDGGIGEISTVGQQYDGDREGDAEGEIDDGGGPGSEPLAVGGDGEDDLCRDVGSVPAAITHPPIPVPANLRHRAVRRAARLPADLPAPVRLDLVVGLPSALRWDNLQEAWTTGQFDRYMGNTVIYCAAIVTGVVVLSCMAGYALALLPLPGRGPILTIFLLGLMVPFQSVMIPIYYFLQDLHLLGTYWAFIVPGIALRLSFGIFLMRGFFRGLPPELADAARLDGANEWQTFRQVMLPLSVPGLATLVVLQFINTWNAFLMPLVFVQRDELRPVALGTLFFFGRFTADRGLIAAGVTISMLPMIVIFLLLQRRFIEGITAGALKS